MKEMTKKRSYILEKVSKFLRDPIRLNMVFFKKQASKFKLLKHYNSGFIQEYQFSSSDEPLILYRVDDSKERKRRDLGTMVVMCLCPGGFRGDYVSNDDGFLGAIEYEERKEREKDESDDDDECWSVDERAERFIEKFYQQMRMQRLDSALLLDC